MAYDKVFKERPFKWGDVSNFIHHMADEKLLSRLHERIGHKPPVTEQEKIEYFKRRLMEEYKKNKNVRMAVDVCVHCGHCMTACPTYITSGDFYNSPVGRAELIRAIIKGERLSGKIFGKAVGAVKNVTMDYLKKVYTYYWLCLICRRCGYACPFGVEQTDVTRIVRGILYEIGMASRFTCMTVDTHYRSGNNMGLTAGAVKSIVDFLLKEIKKEKGVEFKVKIDEPAYALLLPSSADFFMNLETFKGYLLFLYAAGIDFTLSSKAAETANFGLFLHPRHLQNLAEHYVEVARELGVKLVIAGECGHAWRAHKNYTMPRLRQYGIEMVHIWHLVAQAIKEGRIRLNPEANGDILYMYMDPCQYARGGDLTEEPRFIMSHVVKRWVEPQFKKAWTWCCGGQGGNVTDEVVPLAAQYAKLWYEEAVRAGAKWVIRGCSMCKAQLSHVVPYLNKWYNYELKYSGLMDLVYRALVV